MIWQTKVVRCCLVGTLVSACTGTGHQIPNITDAERSRALLEITSAPDPNPTTRTAAENERLARNVLAKLQTAAKPVCTQVERDSCWYTLEYKRSSSVDAGIAQNRMIFTNGLAQHLVSEDEFAAVIGHEIGHHLAFHYEEDAENKAIGSIIATVIFGGLAAATGVYQNNPGGFQSDLGNWYRAGASIGKISFSKEQESEADYLGAYLMTRAGYDPEKGKAVWIKLTKISGRTKTALLDTHPAGPDRLAAWYKTLEEVRYSPDLMPNPVGAEDEARLQVARTFGPSVMDSPVPQVAAVTGDPKVAAVTGGSKTAAVITGPEITDIPSSPASIATASPDREPGASSLTGDTLVPRASVVAPEPAARYATVTSWAGLGGPVDGTLAMIEIGENEGELVFALDPVADTPATRCDGTWSQKRYAGDLIIGSLSLSCDNGRTADGGYRLDGARDGLAGLEDSQGNFVELKLTRL